VKSVLVDRGDQFGVSAVVFDGQEEMLWMGNAGVSFSYIFSYNSSSSYRNNSIDNNLKKIMINKHSVSQTVLI